MEKFAFIIHPLEKNDVAKRYPIARLLPESLVEWILTKKKPQTIAHVTGIRSSTGVEAEGWFIGCPLLPRQFTALPLDFVYSQLETCGHIAEQLGAKILGLGAFTSVVGDGGITLSKRLNIAVTTGNSYTVATAVQGAVEGAKRMGIELETATVAVVGATGSIGATCAEILARDAASVHLVGRTPEKLEALARHLEGVSRARLRVYTDVASGLAEADIVITVSSAAKAIVEPQHIKCGAVVCDVARPRDVSTAVARERDDVLVIEGGVVRVPGEMRCAKVSDGSPFSFGFPQGTAYACMSETMALALDGRYENFTLGKEVSVSQVDEIMEVCTRHGFTLDGFRSFERALSAEEIEQIRRQAERKRRVGVR
jgi:predicted amino acid dehydrogenase